VRKSYSKYVDEIDTRSCREILQAAVKSTKNKNAGILVMVSISSTFFRTLFSYKCPFWQLF
jgi:hypothetical protein